MVELFLVLIYVFLTGCDGEKSQKIVNIERIFEDFKQNNIESAILRTIFLLRARHSQMFYVILFK